MQKGHNTALLTNNNKTWLASMDQLAPNNIPISYDHILYRENLRNNDNERNEINPLIDGENNLQTSVNWQSSRSKRKPDRYGY